MGQTQVSNGGIQPTILEPIQNLYTGSTIVFTVTVASKDSTHRYNGQGSSNGYKIDGKFAPFIVLTPGITYKFDQADGSNSGHPLRFYKDAAKVTAYTTNVTTNGTAGSSGAYTQIVTGDATPTILYYQCSAHGLMGNAVQTNGLASSVPDDGSITTAKIANLAVTAEKIASSAIIESKISNGSVTGVKIANSSSNNSVRAIGTDHVKDDAVTTAKIADQAVTLAKLPHGTSSNDGKFLRANNGADPTFETVSIPAGTTINNNADNRVITGSGTANTLNGESSVVIDANGKLGVGTTAPNTIIHVQGSNNNGELEALRLQNNNTGNQTKTSIGFTNTPQSDYEHARIVATRDNAGRLDFQVGAQSHTVLCVDGYASGVVGVNTVQASKALDVNGEIRTSSGILFGSDTAAANTLDDYEEGNFTPTVSGIASPNYTVAAGRYTKIGNLVTAQAYLLMASGGGLGAPFSISSLPFTSTNTTYKEGGGYIIYESGFFDNGNSVSSKNTCTVWVPANSTIIQFHKRYNGAAIYGNDTSFGTGANNVYLIVQVCYVAA